VTIDNALEYHAIRCLATGPVGSQRTLADTLGVSLGKANYIIRALVPRGLVTVDNVSRSTTRLRYVYYLTPKGFTEKTRLTRCFLRQKLKEYHRLQMEIETLAREAGVPEVRVRVE